jgi:lipoate-protein ligase A
MRFYQWSEPTLSLGYFQRYADRDAHQASRDCAVVRRQTGGGAILHDRELTYSLALPAAHPLARNSRGLYIAVHEAFIDVLKSFDVTRNSAWSLIRRDQDLKNLPASDPFLCFQRRAFGDVLLVGENKIDEDANRIREPSSGNVESSTDGTKILGSAQRRYRSAILQHGSLLFEKSPCAPELAGLSDLTGIRISRESLLTELTNRLANTVEGRIFRAQCPVALELNAEQLTNDKYGCPTWTNRR